MYKIKRMLPNTQEISASQLPYSHQISGFNQRNSHCNTRTDSGQLGIFPVVPNSRRSKWSINHALITFLAIYISSFGISGCGGMVFRNVSASSTTLTATPSTLEFGTVSVGNSSNQKVTLSNSGLDPIQISQLALSSNAFSVNGQGTLPISLAAGSSLSLNVHYTPKDATDSTGQLSVMTSTSLTAAATVQLHGKGSKQTAQTAVLSGLSCATTTITGAGTDTCTVTTNIAAPANGLMVNLSSNSASLTVPASVTVPAGATNVTFNASASLVSTNQKATITATQGSITQSVLISLAAPAVSSTAPAINSLSCGSSSFNSAGTTSCTVTLSIAAPSSGVGVALASSSNAVTVPSSVSVAFGTSAASFTANIGAVTTAQTVTLTAATGSSSKSVSLQLNPGVPALSVNASSVAFGSVVVNTPASQTVTLTSSGTAAVTVNSVVVTGSGFSVSSISLPMTLKPGQTAALTVTFDPTTTGSMTGKLTISSNSSTNATLAIPLTGTATSQSHQVDLNWQAPSSSPVTIVGYNVYRAASGTGSYALLNSSVDTLTSYTDTNVQSGASYDYEVRSVDSAGVESGPSNTTAVTIP